MAIKPEKKLEVFPNPHPDVRYEITHHCLEFTSLCPLTGQPDFAEITITYIPDLKCVELKSLKGYLWSFRNEKGFFEDLSNKIAKDLINVLKPHFLKLEARFNIRGGIKTTIVINYQKEGKNGR
ncbi:MAG: preQ(1) synthase [Thermoanaerobaculia bacterium]